jgi:pyridoxal phosphate enzyme (YggS family)
LNMTLQERIDDVQRRIAASCRKAGRNQSEVKLVAVSKMVEAGVIREAIDCGLHIFGENRVQEFLKKYDELGDMAEWHLIGHLQRNKARYLTGKVSLIHSLDRLALAELLDDLSADNGAPWQVLVQVNVSGEDTKFGISPEELPEFLDKVQDLRGIEVCGLMTMAPFEKDPEKTRPVFRQLRSLRDEMARLKPRFDLRHLSMGMTNDFEIAVEEGATLVRIGSALFSDFYN